MSETNFFATYGQNTRSNNDRSDLNLKELLKEAKVLNVDLSYDLATIPLSDRTDKRNELKIIKSNQYMSRPFNRKSCLPEDMHLVTDLHNDGKILNPYHQILENVRKYQALLNAERLTSGWAIPTGYIPRLQFILDARKRFAKFEDALRFFEREFENNGI